GRVLHGAVPRWRDETKAGISVRGQTFFDPVLVGDVGRLLAALGLEGPANVQGFVAGPGERATFTEVNPRFSGGLPLSLAAGSDLVGQYLVGMTGRPVDAGALGYRPGVRMYRYYQEIFEEGDPA
ncbi:MAG: ATP-grasp domain-containing protein, partial [Acidimicrobiales bacterium]